jgi:hypothetical protein
MNQIARPTALIPSPWLHALHSEGQQAALDPGCWILARMAREIKETSSGLLLDPIGRGEDADSAIDHAIHLLARRWGVHVAKQAQLEEASTAEFQELAGGKLDVVDLETAGLDLACQEIL